MTRRHDGKKRLGGRVGEPIQVYLTRPDRERLERLAAQLEVSKSDVLRRGLAALEGLTRGDSERASPGARPPLPTFRGGDGLQPGVDIDDSAALLDLMDQDDATP